MLKQTKILWKNRRPDPDIMKDVGSFLDESPGKALFILLFVVSTFSISLLLVF